MDNCIKTKCLHNSTCLADSCNIFDKYLNLKTENQNLNIYEQVLENGNHFVGEIQMQTVKCETNNLEKIYLLSEKNDEIIKMPQLQHLDTKEFDKYQESLTMTIKNKCEKLNDGLTHDKSSCSSFAIAKYPFKKELLPESTNKNIDSCEIQQLLHEIEECCCSKEPSDLINKLLERSKTTICSLTKEVEIHSLALKHSQENIKCCSEKLNEEKEISKNKDLELCSMKIELSLLADQLTQTIKHNHFLSSNIDDVSEDLLSRTLAYNDLLKSSEELKEELNNVKFRLNLRIDENECIKKELNEKYQIIGSEIITKRELEFKLINLEKKLVKLEELNNSCNQKYNSLALQNMNLENDLKNEKNYNSKKAVYIDDLSKQIYNLETIIKGVEGHKMLYTEEISKLKNDKHAAELKINEFNSVIKTQKSELVITRSELAYAEECLKKKNDCQIQKIQQLEYECKNFEKEVQFCKIQHDFLTNKCLLSDKDLSESQKMIGLLEIKINEITRERNMIFDDLSKECDNLKSENCELLKNINELNESIIFVNNKEYHLRNDLATCNEKLLITNDEISNFYSEIKCINTKLEKATDKLKCIELELEETKLKLNKETYLKEKINEKYCRIKYECTCPREKCQIGDVNRLSNDNIISCNIERNVEKDVQSIHLKLVDVGSQTYMCPAICQPSTTSINCDSKFHSISNNSYPCKSEQCDLNINILKSCDNFISSCDSDKIRTNPFHMNQKKTPICVNPSDNYSCSGESKNTTKYFSFLFDKENLQCQLNEMKLLLKKKEKAARKELCITEQIYNNKETIINKCLDDTKEQCQKKLDEANAQLETYETAILYKEYELKNSQIREHQYKMAMEQLNETIQIKDKKIESEQKQKVSARNSMKDYEDQLSSLQKTLELEKFNRNKFNESLQLYTDDYNIKNEMDSEMDNKLETSPTFIKKQRFSTKNPRALKMLKTVNKSKRKKYGSKLNLPCCIGSKNPCNRQKTLSLSRKN